jgi:hypothetical protein
MNQMLLMMPKNLNGQKSLMNLRNHLNLMFLMIQKNEISLRDLIHLRYLKKQNYQKSH